MKNTAWHFALLLVAALAFSLAFSACGDDDDDDDSTGDDGQDACERIAECEFADALGIDSMDECLAYVDGLDAMDLDCILAAGSCDDVGDCLDVDDDDDDDDDDNDVDDDDDDDDDDDVDGSPSLTGTYLFVGAEDFDWLMGQQYSNTIGIEEIAYVQPDYSDTVECDLTGGEMWYSLDGGEATKYGPIGPTAGCYYEDYNLVGYDLTQIDGALDETKADHALEMWWIDASDNESNHITYNYKVEDSPYAHGAVMDDWTLMDQDGNDVSLSDFEGEIVVIDGFTGWCTYCGQEANQLADLQVEWNDNLDPVQAVGMMAEDGGGSTNVTEAVLTAYREAHDWDTAKAPIPALADPGFALLDPYMMAAGVPYNMILDSNHVIRAKWHGYGSGIVDSVVEDLLAEMSE